MIKLNFILERVMRRKMICNFIKLFQKKPRTLKIAELIKRTLAEIFVSQNFTDDKGKILLYLLRMLFFQRMLKLQQSFLIVFLIKIIVINNQ